MSEQMTLSLKEPTWMESNQVYFKVPVWGSDCCCTVTSPLLENREQGTVLPLGHWMNAHLMPWGARGGGRKEPTHQAG